MVEDVFTWEENRNGEYTTNYGFNWLLQGREEDNHGTSWTWIWKLRAPENLKFFIWLASHDSLPTLTLLHHRGMSQSSVFQRCLQHEETLLHCRRDCTLAKSMWDALGFGCIDFYNQMHPMTWIKEGATGSREVTFLAGLWWSRRARNIISIGKENFSIHKLLAAVRNLAETICACFHVQRSNTTVEKWILWHSSGENDIIINVDGNCQGYPGRAGFGGLIRNGDGAWMVGFSGYVGHSNILHAELLAILNGLSIAWRRGFANVICYTDSTHALILIRESLPRYHLFASLIQDIKDRLMLPWNCRLQHTLREENQCADFMAKMGTSNEEHLKIHELPPRGLSCHLLADASGVAFLRQ